MSTVINTNVQALNSQRSLKVVGDQASKASEKLSSGLRVNRAGDDAAGLAISEKMRGQIRGLNQASRNSQDGISLIQTAEGALTETHSMLQRMRELIVQASNDSNQESDRAKIALELNELSDEIDSTAEKTEFNKKKLIDGSWADKKLYFQVGANEQQNIQFNIEGMNATSLGVTKAEIGAIVAGTTNVDKIVPGGTYDVKLSEGVPSATITINSLALKFDGLGNVTIPTAAFTFGSSGKFFGIKPELNAKGSAITTTVNVSELAGKSFFDGTDKLYTFAVDGKSVSVTTLGAANYSIAASGAGSANLKTNLSMGGKGSYQYDLGNGEFVTVNVGVGSGNQSSVFVSGNVYDAKTGEKLVKSAGGTGLAFSSESTGSSQAVVIVAKDVVIKVASDGSMEIFNKKTSTGTGNVASSIRLAPAKMQDTTDFAGVYVSADGNSFTLSNDGVIVANKSKTGSGVKNISGSAIGTGGSTLTAKQLAGQIFLTDKGLITFDDEGKNFTIDTSVTTSTVVKDGTYQSSGDGAFLGSVSIEDGKISSITPNLYDSEGEAINSIDAAKGKTFILSDGQTIYVNDDGYVTDQKPLSKEASERNSVAQAAADSVQSQINALDPSASRGQIISTLVTKLDAAIEIVSAQRAQLGAYQNRMEHTIKNLDTSSENLSAAESRIRDTDMAKEMMEFTKSNVLSQAAQSMLAQANQAPNNVLSLLR